MECIEVRCGVCAALRPAWHFTELLPDGMESAASDGWEQVGARFYCRPCVRRLLGRAAPAVRPFFDGSDEEWYEPKHCARCGARRGPARLMWRDKYDDELRDSWAGWQEVGDRHYCPRCVTVLLGKVTA